MYFSTIFVPDELGGVNTARKPTRCAVAITLVVVFATACGVWVDLPTSMAMTSYDLLFDNDSHV